jgi:hypothetical protein
VSQENWVNKSTKIAIFLVLALLSSNAWWAYRVLDLGVSLTYARDGQEEAVRLANETLAVLNVAVSPEHTRTLVIAAASSKANSIEPYEKLGFTWVGGLGLKFGGDGRLEKAIADEQSAGK